MDWDAIETKKHGLGLRRKMAIALLCAALLCTGGFTAALATENDQFGAMDAAIASQASETTYTLHLTHYFRFTVDGEGRNVAAQETIELTDADFQEGVCDLNRFAYDAEPLTVTEANPLSLDSFDANRQGGARIVYAVDDGWRIVPVDEDGSDAADGSSQGTSTENPQAGAQTVVLRDAFQGQLSDYEFVAAKVVRFNMQYKYSSTGGLAGIDAADPAVVEAMAVLQDDGTYVCEFAIPTKEHEGFRIVLDAAPLNKYLVNPPTGDETQEELQEKLHNGDFAGDIANNWIYEYQVQAGDRAAAPDYTVINGEYENRYSTEYNEAWNAARSCTVAGENGYEATAVSGNSADYQPGYKGEHHGANALPNPKLRVALTAEQLQHATENGLDITVNYRRNATWYTVNHWVPVDLSGLTATEIGTKPKKTENGIEYVLLDAEQQQGRVGGLTRAAAKTSGVYDLLVPVGFSQKLIEVVPIDISSSFGVGTTVDIYYKAADSYRVIFDTDYTYIPRQQVELNGSVDFDADAVPMPARKGYRFAGWQYLKKDAEKDSNGEYPESAYVSVSTEQAGGGYSSALQLTSELISQQAKIVNTDGVPVLYLYPKWEPDTTQVTVVLWTEDLSGNDVQAKAEGGESGDSSYYDRKYQNYQTPVQTNLPKEHSSNAESYSNVDSFTVSVETDSSLVQAGVDKRGLIENIQNQVNEHFNDKARDAADGNVGGSKSQFYTQHSFQILHENDTAMDYSTTTANADGRTMIYVYFTRNIYTLQFNYYGNTGSGIRICDNTNGFSYAPEEDIAKFRNTGLDFTYGRSNPKGATGNKESNGYLTARDSNMPVPQTITIRAKYGADLRDVWPRTRTEEQVETTTEGDVKAVSWATTAGEFNKTARNSTTPEPTIIGLYATMDEGIIADPAEPGTMHQLALYWYPSNELSYYRYNHCFELPKFDVSQVEDRKEVTLYEDTRSNLSDVEKLKNTLYLVPIDTPEIRKYGFNDLLKVSYAEKDGNTTIDYGEGDGAYYAVRGYKVGDAVKYYAVARQVDAVSSNDIAAQKPSARAHMTRVNANDVADHTTRYEDTDGRTWEGNAHEWIGAPIDGKPDPYDIYFYYDRDTYTIKYMSTSNKADSSGDVELGHIELPFGAHVTAENYAFKLDMRDTNQALNEQGQHKYRWTYPRDENDQMKAPVPVCPDRNPNGSAPWIFKGWGLGPAGVNMQWIMSTKEDASVPQAQTTDDFYIDSDMLLYAIWETPMLKVTFHLNGGTLSGKANDTEIVERVPANTKITDSAAAIPRPVRGGYNLKGWYEGTVDPSGKANISDKPFEFDQPITEDQHVFAQWESTTDKRYSYTVYHVAPKLSADDSTPHETIQLDDDGNIVQSGGTTYYVLSKQEQKDQVYAQNTVVNLTATLQPGYTPRETNKALEPKEGDSNSAVFIYDAQTPGSSTMNFVEAGTESDRTPVLVKVVTVDADQAAMIPDEATVEELAAGGYELVKKEANGVYTPVTDHRELNWIDEDGNAQSIDTMNSLVAAGKAPASVVYLVRPIPYTITYKNADGSPQGADAVLSAITSMKDISVGVAAAEGKNPTQYTTRDQSFMLKNPRPRAGCRYGEMVPVLALELG